MATKKNRIVNTHFWEDNYITTLDPIEKLLFIYYLTNPMTDISGIYEIQIRRIAFDTGIDKDMIEKITNRFSEDKKIFYIDGYIYVKNFRKHQNNNPSIEIAIEKSLDEIPEEIMNKIKALGIIEDSLITDCTQSGTKEKEKEKENIKENIKEKKPSFCENDKKITDYLLKKVKQRYPFIKNKTEKDLINDYEEMNRLHRIDGFDYNTILAIVNFSQTDDFWCQNIRSVSKLRKQFENLLIKANSKAKQIKKNEITII